MADDKPSDKTRWDLASEGIHRGTVRGAVAGAEEWPEGRLDSLEITWGSIPMYQPDGTVWTDSKEPEVPPVEVKTRYVYQPPTPALPGKKEA